MKKIITFSLLFIMLASAFYTCFAFEIGPKELISLGECEKLLKYQNIERTVQYVIYKKDGKEYPAYCLNPELVGIGTNGTPNYTVSGNTKLENEKAWKAIINGYPYKSLSELGVSTKEEAYTATKFALYTLLQNRRISDYSPVETEAGRRTYNAYLNIVNMAQNSNETLKDNNKIQTVSDSEWKVDDIEKNYICKIYSVSTVTKNGMYTVNLDGEIPDGLKLVNENNIEKNQFELKEKFKILIPIENLTKSSKFKINIESKLESKPVIYGKTSISGTQDYAIAGYMTEDAKLSFEEKYSENVTKLEILKKEYGTEKRLAGVKFNLLDSNKCVIKENLVTDENGCIYIEKLIPGKYYIQEIETLDGYNLYQDFIEVNIKLNEEVQVIVNNTIKSTSKITDVNDVIEITPQYTETLYNVDNNITKLNTKEVKKLPVTGY